MGVIKLSDSVLSLAPVVKLTASASGLTGIKSLSGSGAEGMPAAQSLISLFGEFQEVLNSYIDLIGYDGERISKIIEGFKESDQ